MSRPLFSEDNRDPHSSPHTPAYSPVTLTPPSSTPAWVGVGHKAVTGPDCIECGKPQASYKCLRCREDVCTSLVTDCIARHTDACADREEERLAAIRARMPFRPDPLEHDFVRAPGGRCSVCDYDEASHTRSDLDLVGV